MTMRRRGFGSSTEQHVEAAEREDGRAHDAAKKAQKAATGGKCERAFDHMMEAVESAGAAMGHREGAGRSPTVGKLAHLAIDDARRAIERRCLKR